jgi:lysophospholipase L1-like esterase
MSSIGLTVIAAALFAIAAGAAAPKPAAQRYLALGDSYTIGESVAEAERWPVRLAALLREKGIAVGAPEIVATTGWTVRELGHGIDQAAPRGPYDLVTLLIGVNDQYRRGDPDIYRTDFAAMLERAIGFAGGRAGRVVVLSIPDWGVTPFAARSGRDRETIGAEIDRFNQINREEAAKAGARYVDVTPESRRAAADPALIAPDGLHPSGAMYADWARLAVAAAQAALRGPTPPV